MYGDNIVHDVLSFLPDWGLKEKYESKPVQDYEHSYVKAFLDDSREDKDQLYITKRLTVEEIYEEFHNSEIKIKDYIHREQLPQSEEMYIGLCQYTAGSLYLKYTQDSKNKDHGNWIRSEALQNIDPYIKIDVHDIGHGTRRRVTYPKWFLDTQRNPCWMPSPPYREIHKHPHHEIREHPERGRHYRKPYIIVETLKRHHDAQVRTYKKPLYKAKIKTEKVPFKCRKIPFSARD